MGKGKIPLGKGISPYSIVLKILGHFAFQSSINISAISWSTDFYKNARALLYAS